MEKLQIVPIKTADLRDAARVMARALAATPFSLAIEGDAGSIEEAMTRVFEFILEQTAGQALIAKEDGHVVGVIRIAEWPGCQLNPVQMLRMLPTMFGMGFGPLVRAGKGRAAWGKHDPQEPHWHIDPLAVVPERQGRGIGSQLLEEFCSRVDKANLAAYLETDTRDNVRLYERFGFVVREEMDTIGVHCWLMWRSART